MNPVHSDIQAILCPAGPDGPGNTWLTADGNAALITVRAFASVSPYGVRLENTFQSGYGTTTFSVTSILDNIVQTLSYDFVFTNPTTLTGVQITLSEWMGAAPGLHKLQLLSSDSFASAIVLVSTVPVGTPASQAPTFTWMPYISASGQYNVNLIIPSCDDFQDCALRTSVRVHVSQQVQNDAMVLIYSGPIVLSSSSFMNTVTMSLADQPMAGGQNGEYELVAGNVELILTSANITSSSTTSPSSGSTSVGTRHGFGFFEWPLNSAATIDATGVMLNTSETSLDMVGIDLYNALAIFLGGSFTLTTGSLSGASNVILYKDGSLFPLSNNGLNGAVNSFALYGNELYIGGSFSDTQSASTQGKLMGIAMHNVETNTWSTLGAGVNGVVASIALANTQIQVAGNFTETRSASGLSAGVGGFANWDIKSGSWVNSGGFVMGNLTFVGNGTSSSGQGESQFLAGNVQTMAEYGATGLVMLSDDDNNGPMLLLSGFSSILLSIHLSLPARRRSEVAITGADLQPGFLVLRSIRYLPDNLQQAQSTLPPLPPATAPAVLTGVFWSNSSSSHEVAIIGGNFSFPTSSSAVSQAVAIYDPVTSSVTALAGAQVYGVVRALYVDTESHLYVGGEFNLSDANGNSFAIYDMTTQQWLTTVAQPLQATSGSYVAVRSITTSAYKPNTVIGAGSFAQGGTVTCQGICLFDTILNQRSAMGSDMEGDITSVSYAGNNQEFLIAGGVITLSGGISANIAQYSFANTTWTAIGDQTVIPGRVTSVEEFFLLLISQSSTADDSSPFMVFWDGVSWSNIASSVLFDGQTFIPYIVSMSGQATMGYVSSLFYSITNFSFSQQHFLATGVVILISIAIAAGVVFLLALIGIVWTLLSRRDDKPARYENNDEDDDSIQHRPSSLLEYTNAATRTTILEPDPFGPDASNYLRAETPSDAVVGSMAAEEDVSRPAHARYSFYRTGEVELLLTAGVEIEVLDNRDNAEIISGSEVSTTQSTPSPMSYQWYPSTTSITSPPLTSSPPGNCVLRSSSPTYLKTPLGLKRRRTTPPIKKRTPVGNIVSDFTSLKEGYLECSETPSKYSDRGSIFDDLSSDSDGPDTEFMGARLVLEAARAQRNVRHAEKVLSKYLSEEHIALGRVYQFQEAKANRRLVNAECIIGAVRNSMRTNGIPFNTQVPILKRRRSSVDSNSAADELELGSRRTSVRRIAEAPLALTT
ncbi:cortical protein marker for cell polarity-domain-containing protein [Melanogaster broomeanus]|nr:cortical protein marker for cell polarity-domain-containing protein [Melanogaster broomeanus]